MQNEWHYTYIDASPAPTFCIHCTLKNANSIHQNVCIVYMFFCCKIQMALRHHSVTINQIRYNESYIQVHNLGSKTNKETYDYPFNAQTINFRIFLTKIFILIFLYEYSRCISIRAIFDAFSWQGPEKQPTTTSERQCL